MYRHYKNRCGQGKAAANGFLMNLIGELPDSGAPSVAETTKACGFKSFFAGCRSRALARKIFKIFA
jgi:hypothetical protein